MSLFKFKPFFKFLSRGGFSSSPAINTVADNLPKFRCLNRIHNDYKPMAIREAQKALRDYLHATKSIPFAIAELIALNSSFSLAALFPKLRFSTKTFPATFRQLLSYDPINEFEFFFESIGVEYTEVHRFLTPNTFFFSQDQTTLGAAVELYSFGFPWKMIGRLCSADILVLRKSPSELSERLCAMRDRYGLNSLALVDIVLAFPRLLGVENEESCYEIFDCLKSVFEGLDGNSCFEENLDVSYQLCRIVELFWDLGCDKRTVVDLMRNKMDVFLGCSVEDLKQKFEFFSKFGVEEDIGMFLLQRTELLSVDIETRVVSIVGFLEHFGLEGRELQCVCQKYSHVLGRNRMANIPNIMKAIDLHKWCFEKIKSSNGHRLLETYAIKSPEEGVDLASVDSRKSIESSTCRFYTKNKLEFLKGVGFGDNLKTIRVLNRVKGDRDNLQKRFNCLVQLGFKHSDICLMLITTPEIICRNPESLEGKVNFLLGEIGLPMEFLVAWPKILKYGLETRIKRRFRVLVWLGLGKNYSSIPYIIDQYENQFIQRLYRYHPAVPKQYLECF